MVLQVENPGPGGFGVVLKAGVVSQRTDGRIPEDDQQSDGIAGCHRGLEALKQPGWQVVVYSDSRYVVDAVEKGWVFGWEKKGFKDKKNPDLWKRFLAIYRQHQVKFVWVKGHADIPENERCDQLAVQASKMPNLQIDYYYEAEQDNNLKLFI